MPIEKPPPAATTPRDGAGASTFALAVLAVTAEARRLGLTVPNFRSPPRPAGAVRTIARFPGGPIVSIAVIGRTVSSVSSDVVDGVLAANALSGESAGDVRTKLLAAVRADLHRSAA